MSRGTQVFVELMVAALLVVAAFYVVPDACAKLGPYGAKERDEYEMMLALNRSQIEANKKLCSLKREGYYRFGGNASDKAQMEMICNSVRGL